MSKVIPIKGAHPWSNTEVPEGYEIAPEGVSQVDRKNKSTEKLAGPVWVSAFTEDDQSGIHGVVIRWLNRKGKECERAFPADILHEQGRTLSQLLARNGLAIVPGKEQQLSKYLGSFDSDVLPWIRSAPRVGWLDSTDEHLTYVLPDKVITADQSEHVIFQPEQHSPTVKTMYPQGTLADWQAHVAQPCRGNPFLIFSMCTAFAGPLLKAARIESGGFHIYGLTSRGKTTAAQVAASVFGCGADPSDAAGSAYIQKWNTTGNGLEALSAAHNDGLLILDEIQTCDSKDFGSVVYNLFSGRGKTRLDKNAGMKELRTWRALVLSTGEKSSRQKIEEEGSRKAYAGQLLRLLDIPTHDAIIADSHDMDGKNFADQLKRTCGRYFGTAGPGFIEAIVRHYENARAFSAVVQRLLDECEKDLTLSNSEPEQQRVIKRFALVLVAGRLACEFSVVPFNRKEIESAVLAVIKAWLADGANLPDRVRGAQAVQAFIQRHRSRLRKWDSEDEQVRDLAGYIKDELFLFTPEGFREAANGHDPEEVARELHRCGLLMRDGRNMKPKYSIMLGGAFNRIRLYAVKNTILEHDFAGHIPVSEDLLVEQTA
jgi:uncharacterized protein (DUF927 family)